MMSRISITTRVTASTDVNYRNLTADNVEVVNRDNDVAAINVTPTSGLATDEQRMQANFTVVLGSQPTSDVTIQFSSSDTSEGTVSPAQFVFTAANWSTPQTVAITGPTTTCSTGTSHTRSSRPRLSARRQV